MKNSCRRKIKQSLEFRVINRKGDKLYVKYTGYDDKFNSWIDKKDVAQTVKLLQLLYEMSQYFPKPQECSSGNINVEMDLSIYPTKTDLKAATGVDTSNVAAKSDLASLKAKVDKIDIEKLKTENQQKADLSKLTNLVDNELVNNTLCDKLYARVYTVDTSVFVSS